MRLENERAQVVEYGKRLVQQGLATGTFGNISVYQPEEGLMAISPSGMDYFKTEPEDVAVLTLDGVQVDGRAKPSSEADMHRIFYQNRPEIRAVVHTHSTFATTLACMNWGIEPVHYLIAYAGADVPCIPYVRAGTYALAQAALDGMGPRHACLLGNHGLLAVGESMAYAFDVAQQMEFVAEVYYRCKLAGGGVNMPPQELEHMLDNFHNYRTK